MTIIQDNIVLLYFSESDVFPDELVSSGVNVLFRPEALMGLHEKGVPYETFESLGQSRGFLLDSEHIEEFSSWLGEADYELNNCLPEIVGEDFSFFRANSLFIRRPFFKLYSEFYRVSFLLKKFPSAKFYFNSSKESSLFIEIIESLPRGGNISFIDLVKSRKSFRLDFQLDIPESRIKASTLRLLKDIVKTSHFGFTQILQSVLKKSFRGNKKILILGLMYDGKEICKELRKSNVDLVFWDLMRFRRGVLPDKIKEKISRKIKIRLSSHNWTKIEDCNFSPLFSDMIDDLIFDYLDDALTVFKSFKKLHELYKFDGVFSSMPSFESQIIFRVCSYNSIPSYQTIHGGTLGVYKFFPPMPNVFTDEAYNKRTCLIVYSDWLERELKKYKMQSSTFKSDIQSLGSPYFEYLMDSMK